MRIAVLADIHGNIRALEAVQADLGRHSPDIVVNLGDHVSGPLQAAATADLLMSERYVQIRGNHDRQLSDRHPERMGASDRAAHAQLNSRHLEWLANLPASQIIGEDILLCHGSPRDDLEYLLEEVSGDGVRLSRPPSIQLRLGGVERPLVLCGHTHISRDVRLTNGVRVVNPGSVGLQAYDDIVPSLHYIENGSPEARYAIIDWSPKGARVSFVVIPYDWESASKEAVKAHRPDWAHALATGYALRPAL
jgi:putative phosphoesterase